MSIFARYMPPLFLAALLAGLVHMTFSKAGAEAGELSGTPWSIKAVERTIEAELDKGEVADIDGVRRQMARLLKRDPLSDDAILYHAKSQIAQKNWSGSSRGLLDVVKDRNPRNRDNLKTRLTYALQVSDFETSVDTVDIIFRLEEDQLVPILDLLGVLYGYDAGRAVIDARLSQRPAWGWNFVNSQTSKSPPERLDIVQKSLMLYAQATPNKQDMFRPTERLITRYVQEGRVEAAYDLWQSVTALAGGEVTPDDTLNYNPAFETRASPAPFNWALSRSGDVTVNFETVGLYASFSGDRLTPIATQYFTPQDSAMQLSVEADYRYFERQGLFRVALDCAVPQQAGLSVDLNNAARDRGMVTADFAGWAAPCALARVNVSAAPGIFSERISVTLRKIAVTSKGSTAKGSAAGGQL